MRFKRSFRPGTPFDGFDAGSCLYYRYVLTGPCGSWENWRYLRAALHQPSR